MIDKYFMFIRKEDNFKNYNKKIKGSKQKKKF